MPRNTGVFDFSSNFEVRIVAPLDARMVVPNKADLWSAQMQASYPYAGMIAAVAEESGQKGLYILEQLPCIEENWRRVGAGQGFLTLTEAHFTDATFATEFPGATAPSITNIKFIEYTFEDFTSPETTIVMSINATGATQHYIIKLPQITEVDAIEKAGTRIRFFCKKNTLPTSQFLVLASDWVTSGTQSRILSIGAKTEIDDMGYFLSLEPMEVVDLFWDGEDWIALSTNKRDYTQPEATDFLNQDPLYLNRY